MSSKGLNIAPPPRRPANNSKPSTAPKKRTPSKLKHIAETDTVQFNRRIPQGTSDGYEILAVKTKMSVPQLLVEGLELLEEKYGKV